MKMVNTFDDGPVPTVSFTDGALFHVGTMNAHDKRGNSHEGDGLSVTTHPQEWAQITSLRGCTWRLSRDGNQFVDAHALTDVARQQIFDWAVVYGWVTYMSMWEATYNDDELGGAVTTLFTSHQEAVNEFEGWDDNEWAVVEHVRPVPTSALTSRMLWTGDASMFAADWALIAWVEDATAFDGVWFADRVDPLSFSSPRGVICRSRVGVWTATPA